LVVSLPFFRPIQQTAEFVLRLAIAEFEHPSLDAFISRR
jgi:hypothetical protein